MATETGDGTADADDAVSESPDTEAAENVEADIDVDEDVDIEEDVDADEDTGYSQYARSVIVTTVSTLAGVAVAFISALYMENPESSTSLLLVAAAAFIQFPLYKLMGMDVDNFGMKGKIYIVFMTFILWFLTLGLILTTGATDAL